MEYKDYRNFLLPFNDPPPLVREQAYPLLARSAHVVTPQNERGWQCEIVLQRPGSFALTANFSQAAGRPFGVTNWFHEAFLDGEYDISDIVAVTGFYDWSEDGMTREENRHAFGLYGQASGWRNWGARVGAESQTFDRSFAPRRRIWNHAASFTVTRAPALSAGMVWEVSTDPLLIDNPATVEQEHETRHWVGVNARCQLGNHYVFRVFAGRRRGGPACASGVCYEVLDFEGFEFVITVRF
jgi:hypothetical protein